jgi:hypothetical protein
LQYKLHVDSVTDMGWDKELKWRFWCLRRLWNGCVVYVMNGLKWVCNPIGMIAWRIENLDWHRSPVKRSVVFWKRYWWVWIHAERVRKWVYSRKDW